jgi:hypothetical protein
MTLCVAWVRKTVQPPEMVFATDSRLSSPGRWDVGVKLFELPRRGALIAFHGVATLAHTLLQHVEHDLVTRPEFTGPRVDLHDLVEPIREHFSRLFNEFRGLATATERQSLAKDKTDTGFLLGGWSWRQQAHALWRFDYNAAAGQFLATEVTREADNLFAFVGDAAAAAEAELKNVAATQPLGMEALRILHARTHPDDLRSSVGGSMQAAKIYASGLVEFLAVAWPTGDGEIFRRAARFSRGEFRHPVYLDPITGDEISIVPERLPITDNYDWGAEEDFIRRCYPAESDYQLKAELPDHERLRLVAALKAVGFERLVQSFSPGHKIISKLLNSQTERLREIASRLEDGEIRRQIEEFLNEPFSDEAEEIGGAVATMQNGAANE